MPRLKRSLVLALSVAAVSPAPAEESTSSARVKRVPWTTSRVVGSPDPPAPYRARRAFPQLTFNRPVYLATEPTSGRILVVEQGGKVLSFPKDFRADKPEVFLEIKGHETYSLAFHPTYGTNGFVFVFSNGPTAGPVIKDRIWRYQVKRGSPTRCDPASARLVIEWESNGHNGGDLAFAPDGYLYLTSGDGTSDSDGNVTGQDLKDLASGIIRIDVDHPDPGKNYSVPKDNPFRGLQGARPELYAFGLRNPWRMSLDPATGNLWVGDVGQDLWEMIHLVRRGANYGWSVYEGSHPFQLQRKLGPAPVVPPIVEHHHSESRSITGGMVYHGTRFKELQGVYVYGDYATGRVWGFRYVDGKVAWRKELASTRLQIVGFGQDDRKEIYLVDYAGGIYELEPSPPGTPTNAFPRKLSETGLFLSVSGHRPHPALIPYEVNAALWSDGAGKERFIALPGEERIDFTEDGAWGLPEGTVLVKTFSLDTVGRSKRRIETRLLTRQEGEWHGYTYQWNEAQTEAELVPAAGADRAFTVTDANAPGGTRQQIWHYPSRAECMVCHSRAAGFVLGLNTLQMNKGTNGAQSHKGQLATLEDFGVFRISSLEHVKGWESRYRAWKATIGAQLVQAAKPLNPSLVAVLAALCNTFGDGADALMRAVMNRLVTDLERSPQHTTLLRKRPIDYTRLVDPSDERQDLALRARSYLHANCAQCHIMAGGGNSAIDLHFNTAPENMRLVGVKPLHDRFGLPDALLVSPGHPERSILHYRLMHRGPGQMPPLSSSVVDERAGRLISQWINQLGRSTGAVR
jgi:glucose/arabinose dehydrogenase